MTPDSDSAPGLPETASEPATLPAAEHRAIDAAVAAVAGLLVGRALFGRAGGLVAGLAAAGAGLLAKRRPGTKLPEPATVPVNGAPPPPAFVESLTPVPETQMRLETGRGTIDDDWVAVAGEAQASPGMSEFEALMIAEGKPKSPEFTGDEVTAEALPGSDPDKAGPQVAPMELTEDAGAFAELPALFGPIDSSAELNSTATPEVDLAAVAEPPASTAAEPVAFDDGPGSGDGNVLPVDQLVIRAEEALEKDSFPDDGAVPGKLGPMPAPSSHFFGLLDDLPAEFSARKEEEEPGPRGDFLLIPDLIAPTASAEPVPPIHKVVAALSESLEPSAGPALEPKPEEPGEDLKGVAAEPEEEAGVNLFADADPSRNVSAAATAAVGDAEPGPVPPVPFPVMAGFPVLPALRLLANAPETPPVPVSAETPVADPEEIWRQAAAELTALRNAPARPFPPVSVPAPDVVPGTPAFPVLAANMGTTPIVGSAPAVTPAEPAVPPWLKAAPGDEAPAAGHPAHDPSRDKAFLPTIKLSVPQGPQPMAARRPPVLPPAPAPAPDPAPVSLAVAPVMLTGYRAEPAAPIPPPLPSRDPVTDFDALLPNLPPLPPPPSAAAATASIPAAALTAPPAFAATGQSSVPNGDGKIFVPRVTSHRHTHEPYRRRTITAFRVAILTVAAAAALGIAYKPELKELWNQKILGKPPAKAREKTQPKPAEAKDASDPGSGVSIAPEPPPTPKSTPAAKPATTPDSAPLSRPAPPDTPSTPPAPPPEAPAPPVPAAINQPSADSVPAVVTPPPAAEPASAGLLPASEAGARELISRLLLATTPDGVTPYVFDAVRLGPALESYFSRGRAVPVASYESFLERADKSAVTGRTVWLFRVTTDNVPRGFPLGVEDTPDGLRADWELFTQCRDGALQAFLADPSAPPGHFFAALKRAHVFPDMLPGRDHTKFFAFDLSSPALGDASHNAFIPKNTPLATRADNLYKFSTPYAPLLELAHKDGHVEITGIIRENWRTASRSVSR